MPVELIWETDERIDGLKALLTQVANAAFALEGIENAGMSIRIVDDAAIQALNLQMRGIDRATDVLSFPTVHYRPGTTARDNPSRVRREYDPSVGGPYLGDCVISLARARAQAAEYGHSLSRELGYLTAHSCFHLLGYDHMTEAEKRCMRENEERVMRALSLAREPSGASPEDDRADRCGNPERRGGASSAGRYSGERNDSADCCGDVREYSMTPAQKEENS